MWQKGRRRRRRQGGGGPAKLRAGHTAAILFAYPDALLDAFPACGSSPPSRGRHPARRLLIRLRHRLTAEAAARRCPIWARRQHGGGVRFGHVRPAIRGGGRQAGQGHWWAPAWRRGMGWTPGRDKGWGRAPGEAGVGECDGK